MAVLSAKGDGKMRTTMLRILLFSLLGVIAFCMVAIAFEILSASVLPLTFIGACLGAIVSAIITQVLLSGQTNLEEIKERNVKVFEKKSMLFNDYIDNLWCVLEKQKLSIDDYDKLRKDFSIRLMIYLKEKEIRSIAAYLRMVGDCVNQHESYEFLKEQVFNIINVLSGAIDLGGKIDIAVHRELEEPIFPKLFKQAILNEINKAFFEEPEIGSHLSEGIYCKEDDLISDGEWGGEYICFDFRGYKGCKLLIGSFSKFCPHAGIWMLLFIDKNIHSVDGLRYSDEKEYRFCEFSKYLVEVWDKGGEDGEWVELTTPHPDNEEYASLGEFDVPPEDWWLFLDDPDAIEPYRQNYQEVARIMGKRSKYWFKNGLIWEKEEDKLISIADFLKKYMGKQEEN